ncbi:HNH endonuclease signature motif containing protein [Sulfitobacter sp. S190]|uniref:HNH endonuclease signature motif containing protein n=1 Tax=Sulfitobacter sp. S190 TaxID=2867022 RepID=UPI0021A49DC5|nr:HNH endonuclease signature motif containing protein [Sulfitobacter sp. S190]UWR22635.1 HNH endonuclease [Sulfitobacter sp. S190]
MARWPYCTTQWQKLRLAKLASSPVCIICEMRGFATEANTVDHITPIRKGGDPFPSLDGLMSLCGPCHSEKTANVDRDHVNSTGRRFKGCNVDGNPVDPSDTWWKVST